MNQEDSSSNKRDHDTMLKINSPPKTNNNNFNNNKSKKLKLERDNNREEDIKFDNDKIKLDQEIENEIKIIRNQLQPVLGDEECREYENLEMYCIEIEPQYGTGYIKILSNIYKDEFKELDHLKKIRKMNDKLQLLLCKKENIPNLLEIIENKSTNTNDNSNNSISDKDKLINFLKSSKIHSLSIVNVPKYSPLTYEKFSKSNEIWPCVFKSHNFSTPLITTLEDKELLQMKEFMKVAIEQAKFSKTNGNRPIGGILVDPETNIIILLGHDQTNRIENHNLTPFLSHCIMILMNKLSCIHVKEYPNGIKNQDQNDINNNNNNTIDNNYNNIPYLATSFHLYLTREPCVMCSMALVHSRIKRVIYGSSSSGGGLGTRLKIHTEKSLNHKFEVYRGLMEKECNSLFDDDNNKI